MAFQGRLHEDPALRPAVLAAFAAENVAQLAAALGDKFLLMSCCDGLGKRW